MTFCQTTPDRNIFYISLTCLIITNRFHFIHVRAVSGQMVLIQPHKMPWALSALVW